MAITSLSSSLTGTLANQTGSTGKKTGTASPATPSIGKQLLAALAQAQGSTANPLVSLGQSDSPALTYDAKGLLRQLQTNTLNNPLWQDNSNDNSDSNAQAQSLFSAQQTPSASASTSAADAKAQALAVINGSATGNNSNWAQMLKQNPALAGAMVDQQSSQSMISMLA